MCKMLKISKLSVRFHMRNNTTSVFNLSTVINDGQDIIFTIYITLHSFVEAVGYILKL